MPTVSRWFCWLQENWVSAIPWWVASSADSNSLKHPTSSQLLNCSFWLKTEGNEIPGSPGITLDGTPQHTAPKADNFVFIHVGNSFRRLLAMGCHCLRERLFEVVGFDAADVVRRCGKQRVHQHVERIPELQAEKTFWTHVPIQGTDLECPCSIIWPAAQQIVPEIQQFSS